MQLRSGAYKPIDQAYFGPPRPPPARARSLRAVVVVDTTKQTLMEQAMTSHQETMNQSNELDRTFVLNSTNKVKPIASPAQMAIDGTNTVASSFPFGSYFSYSTSRGYQMAQDALKDPGTMLLQAGTVPAGTLAGRYIGRRVGKAVFNRIDPSMGGFDYLSSFAPGAGPQPVTDFFGGYGGEIVGALAGGDAAYRLTLKHADRLKSAVRRVGTAAYNRLTSYSQQPAKYVTAVQPKAPSSQLYNQVQKDRPDQFKAPTLLLRNMSKHERLKAMQQMSQAMGHHAAARVESFKSEAVASVEKSLGMAPSASNSVASGINGRVKSIFAKIAANPVAQTATITAMGKLGAAILKTQQTVESVGGAVESGQMQAGYYTAVANYISALVRGTVTPEVVVPDRTAFQKAYDYLLLKTGQLPKEELSVVAGSTDTATTLPYKFLMDTLKVLGYGSADDPLPPPPPVKIAEVIQPASLLQSVGNTLTNAFTFVSSAVQSHPYIAGGLALSAGAAAAWGAYRARNQRVAANGVRTSRNTLEDRALQNGNDFQGNTSKRMANYPKLVALDDARRQSALAANAQLAGAGSMTPFMGATTPAGKHLGSMGKMERLKFMQATSMGQMQVHQVASDAARATITNTNEDLVKILDQLDNYINDESFALDPPEETQAKLEDLLNLDLSIVQHVDEEAKTVLDIAKQGQYMMSTDHQLVPAPRRQMHHMAALFELKRLDETRMSLMRQLSNSGFSYPIQPIVIPSQPLADQVDQQTTPATQQESTSGGTDSILRQGMTPATINQGPNYAYSFYNPSSTSGPQMADSYYLGQDFNKAVYSDTLLSTATENPLVTILKRRIQNKLLQKLMPAAYNKEHVPHEAEAIRQLQTQYGSYVSRNDLYTLSRDPDISNKVAAAFDNDPFTAQLISQFQIKNGNNALATHQIIRFAKESQFRILKQVQQQPHKNFREYSDPAVNQAKTDQFITQLFDPHTYVPVSKEVDRLDDARSRLNHARAVVEELRKQTGTGSQPGPIVGNNPATWSPTPMEGADQLGHATDENAIPIIDTLD